MTTRVTIDAHAGWDVEVELKQLDFAGVHTSTTSVKVPKFHVRDFYVHEHMKISGIKELRNEEATNAASPS